MSQFLYSAIAALFMLCACDGPMAQSKPAQDTPSEAPLEPGFSLDDIATRFAEAIRERENLAPFMAAEYTFVYHSLDRCDGQVDGQAKGLTGHAIDRSLDFQITSDGNGWACPAREPYTNKARFKLRDGFKNWDRFEVLEIDRGSNTAYIVGEGEASYIAITLTASGLIERIEYRQEDPG